MALSRTQKEAQVAKIKDIAQNAKTIVFVHFNGLTMPDATALRAALRENEVGYTVVKKTLAKRVFSEADIAGELPALDGELAIAYSEVEPTAPAREIFSFGKGVDGKVAISGGVFAGEFKNAEEMTEIAMIPSLQVLRGMFVNVINSPIQGLVVALGQIAEKKSE